MSDWGYPTGYGRVGDFTDAGCTTGAGNTKGAYAQVIASTAFDAVGILVSVRCNTGKSTYLCDIAVGAAASEVVVVPNILTQMDSSSGNDVWDDPIYFPIFIPAGTRLSARMQCTLSSIATGVRVALVGGPLTGFGGLGRVTAYGAVTASSRGVEMTPPASGNGAYAELTSSTTALTKQLMICMSTQINNTVAYGGAMDLAVGAGGSEQNIIVNMPWLSRAVSAATPIIFGARRLMTLPFSIPAGTRIAARCNGAGTVGALKVSIIAYGID